MSRSGYVDDCDDPWTFILWRGAVASAIRGRRGQAFLREMLTALDEIPSKQLIDRDWETSAGVCALGAVALQRHIDLSGIDPEERDARNNVAAMLNIAPALAAEIMYENDEGAVYWRSESPERCWERVRAWVESHIK